MVLGEVGGCLAFPALLPDLLWCVQLRPLLHMHQLCESLRPLALLPRPIPHHSLIHHFLCECGIVDVGVAAVGAAHVVDALAGEEGVQVAVGRVVHVRGVAREQLGALV